MELRQYFSTLLRWWWLILLSTVIAATATYVVSKRSTPIYQTKTTLMVGSMIRNPDTSSTDLYTSQMLAQTYSQLVLREPVLSAALESLNLDMPWEALLSQVNVYTVYNTQLLEIVVIDSDPYRAKALADAIAEQLILQSSSTPDELSIEQNQFAQEQLQDLKAKIESGKEELQRLNEELDASNSARQIQELQSQITLIESKVSDWQMAYAELLRSLQGGNVNTLSILEAAAFPYSPISPNVRRNVLISAAVGFMLSLIAILLMEYLDDSISGVEEVQRFTDLPILSEINRIKGKTYNEKLVAAAFPLSPITDTFRILRMNITSQVGEPPVAVMVTSSEPFSGKSIITANLAIVAAQSGLKVVLVDADLRKPVVHEIFDVQNRKGLRDILFSNEVKARSYLMETSIPNLRLLTSGGPPTEPLDVLGSQQMASIIDELKSDADWILFDTPPALLVADPLLLGKFLNGAILVVQSGRTRSGLFKSMMKMLKQVNVPLLGIVINNQLKPRGYGYGYGYGYGHGYGDNSKSASKKNNLSIRSLKKTRKGESKGVSARQRG